MELLPRVVVLFLLLFISRTFWVCRAVDCGGKKVARTITVDQRGKGNFRTVQAAIDSVVNNNNRWAKIHINAGTYMEKVQIPREKPCIFLEGQGRGVTTITYNDHQQTDTSATFSSSPNNVVARGITFKNSFNVAAALDLHYRTMESSVVPAAAARIYGDKSAFFNCGFIGYQDTLFDVQGRHYFKNCIIEGAVDFIFGSGQSYYEDCVLKVLGSGFVTAQGRSSEKDPSGFIFRRGKVVGSGQVMLGRAWRSHSRVIFHRTNLGSVVAPQGWNAWHFTGQEAKFTYAEVGCRGAGANTSQRVPWMRKLSTSHLKRFSKSSFINHDGWLAKLPLLVK